MSLRGVYKEQCSYLNKGKETFNVEKADNLNNSIPWESRKNENFCLVIDKTVCEQENPE